MIFYEKKTSTEMQMDKFLERNNNILKNPILKNFLKDNYQLVKNAVINPTKKNKDDVDKAFKLYFKRVKKINYVSKLIYFFSIEFDKKEREIQRSLILDQDVFENDSNTTVKNLIKSSYQECVITLYGSSLKDHIENKKLFKALDSLTDKQLYILEMIYLHGMLMKDVALYLKTTTQNISNQHRKFKFTDFPLENEFI